MNIIIRKADPTESGILIEDDIWELRPMRDRILFAYWKDNKFLLLHHFVKKTQKTPQREIDQAKRNMADFLERSK